MPSRVRSPGTCPWFAETFSTTAAPVCYIEQAAMLALNCMVNPVAGLRGLGMTDVRLEKLR